MTRAAAVFVLLCVARLASAQAAAPPSAEGDGRAQYPAVLANSFASMSVGYINYPFSDLQLEPGHRVESIQVPHVAARAVLFGHHFGKYVSAQASYMRPVKYVKYLNVDGAAGTQTAWMHFGTVTLLGRVPLNERLALYAESGIAVNNRSGFEIGDRSIVRDLHFTSPLFGGGIEYRVGSAVDVTAGTTYIPKRDEGRQPYTLFTAAGLRYNMRRLTAAQVADTVSAGFIFPKHVVQAGYTTDAVGFGVNQFVSKTVPIFWGGHVRVKRSVLTLTYQRNLFHTKKIFGFDIGGSFGRWTSQANGETFQTLSIYPLARFTLIRSRPADVYFGYAVAGPSYISREMIDGLDMGGHFTFQDFMALGMFAGAARHFNVELNLNHYSNGNILHDNAGVRIPLSFKLGYAF